MRFLITVIVVSVLYFKRIIIAMIVAGTLLAFLTGCSVAMANQSLEKQEVVAIDGCYLLQPYMKSLFDNGYRVVASMRVGHMNVLIASHWLDTTSDIMKGSRKENRAVVFGVINGIYACPIMKGERFEAAFLSSEL